MKKLRALFKKEQGNALVLASLAMMGLLAMAGLVIDGGMVYMTKSHLQKVANAAVLSGAQELTNSEEKVKTIVDEVLASHVEQTSLQQLSITFQDQVSIDLQKPVNLTFSALLGKDVVYVNAHATAQLRVMGRATGAAPLGIDDSIALEHYKVYKLKVDQTEVDTGNFGVLALGGAGADTYEDNLRYGYQEEVKVGDILETQTGNIAGKTRTVVQEKVDGCYENPRDVHDRNCSRVILVPVYKPYYTATNQLQEVQITGFAYFYITESMSMHDTSITGMFIKRPGTGYEEPNASNKGAYSIRLTE